MIRSFLTAAVLAAVLFSGTGAHAAWTKQFELFGSGNSTVAVAAGTGKNAVAFGQNSQQGQAKPALYYTMDGKTWQTTQAPGDFAFMITLDMPDAKFVYGGGLGMFKSQNGGSSYSEVKLPGGGGMFEFITISRIFALDPVHVWAVGGDKVYRTPNSLNWEVTTPVPDLEINTVWFLSSQKGWIAGGKADEITETDPMSGEEKVVGYDYKSQGTVMYSTDGGKSFAPLVIGAPDYFQHITFLNDNIGLAVASSNSRPFYFKRTTDGGKTWKDIDLPPADAGMEWVHVSRIAMISPLEGWAAGCIAIPDSDIDNMGNKAVILHTMDGGTSWDFDPEGEGQGGYLDIDFAGPHWGWVVGTFGRIMAYDDGSVWTPPEQEPDIVQQEDGASVGDGVPGEDVGPWAGVFGQFGDEVTIGANSWPAGGDGHGINVGTDDIGCEKVTRTTGCAVAGWGGTGTTGSGASTGAAALLLAGALALLAALRTSTTTPPAASPPLTGTTVAPAASPPLTGTTVAPAASPKRRSYLSYASYMSYSSYVLPAALALTACSGETTDLTCPEAITQPLPVPDTRAGDDAGADAAAVPTEFDCVLRSGDAAADFFPTLARETSKNNFLVYVKSAEGGGSDLVLVTPDGKQSVPLTRFESPAVEVRHPAWSPDRKYVAFVSDFRSEFNDKRLNVFVVAIDGSRCHALTPGVESARVREDSELTVTATGFFKYGQGSIAAPVQGAGVAFPGGSAHVLTGAGGEFQIKLPPGKGRVVLRGTINGMTVKGLAEYEAEGGKSVDLGTTIGFIEADYRVGPLFWSHDSSRLFAFASEAVDTLISIDPKTGESTPFLEKADDLVTTFAPFPDQPLAMVAFKSAPESYSLYSLEDKPASVQEFPFAGQTAGAFVALSPMRFVATFQGDKLLLLGADSAGKLKIVDASPGKMTGFLPAQLDWSMSGTEIVTTLDSSGKTNLVVVDANTGTTRAITTHGKASMPAWFGR
ncbi:MAG: hypothetical protein FJ109_17855 [Deltaproteobacteria bacterium]|nr:hypothetical protein [Deltaproteobacteria bacterium]